MKRVPLSLKLATGYCAAVAAIALLAAISGGSLWAFIIYGATYPSILLVDRQLLVIPESIPVWASLTGVTLVNATGVWFLTEAACLIVDALKQKRVDSTGTETTRLRAVMPDPNRSAKVMRPFEKSPPPLTPVSRNGLTATYNADLKRWTFCCEGIEFWLSGATFSETAFDWAGDAAATVRDLADQIRPHVKEGLDGCLADPSKAHISRIDLDEYPGSQTISVEFVGDETWGDLGVEVVITRGVVVGSYARD